MGWENVTADANKNRKKTQNAFNPNHLNFHLSFLFPLNSRLNKTVFFCGRLMRMLAMFTGQGSKWPQLRSLKQSQRRSLSRKKIELANIVIVMKFLEDNATLLAPQFAFCLVEKLKLFFKMLLRFFPKILRYKLRSTTSFSFSRF